MRTVINSNHICALFIFFSLAEISRSQVPLSQTHVPSPSSHHQRRNTNTQLTLRHHNRLAPSLHHTTTPYSLEALLSGQGNVLSNLSYKYDLRAQYVPKNSDFFYSLAELHLTKSYKKTTWSLGRKILPWNRSEAYWGTTEINGHDGITATNPKQEGLIGFHLEQKMGALTGELFASYLFIPRLNPGNYTQGGRFFSRNEWGAAPPHTMRIKDGIAPIRYSIERPDTKETFNDFILNGSLGFSLSHQYRTGSVSGALRAYGIYKPENELRFLAKSFYKQEEYSIGYTDTSISAFVPHHTLLGTEIFHQYGSLSWNIHLSHNRPYPQKHEPLPSQSNFFILYDENYYKTTSFFSSLGYRYNPWHIGLHYLNIRQDEVYNQQRRMTALSKVPVWHKAFGFSVTYQGESSWYGFFDLKYDYHFDNTIMRGEVAYRFPRRWSVGTKVEVIQSPHQQKINYWKKYRTNDTIQTYLTYLF